MALQSQLGSKLCFRLLQRHFIVQLRLNILYLHPNYLKTPTRTVTQSQLSTANPSI